MLPSTVIDIHRLAACRFFLIEGIKSLQYGTHNHFTQRIVQDLIFGGILHAFVDHSLWENSDGCTAKDWFVLLCCCDLMRIQISISTAMTGTYNRVFISLGFWLELDPHTNFMPPVSASWELAAYPVSGCWLCKVFLQIVKSSLFVELAVSQVSFIKNNFQLFTSNFIGNNTD